MSAINGHQRAALQAFVQLYAETEYMQRKYHATRDSLREGGARVAGAALGTTRDAMLSGAALLPRPNWDLDQRRQWVTFAVNTLAILAK